MPRTRSFTPSCMMMPLINLRRSWQDSYMAPEGYLAIYVRPGRTRFVIKTESVNHPLFRVLLEEAEKEYGFVCAGPLTLPCDVTVFHRIIEALGKYCGGLSVHCLGAKGRPSRRPSMPGIEGRREGRPLAPNEISISFLIHINPSLGDRKKNPAIFDRSRCLRKCSTLLRILFDWPIQESKRGCC